MSMNDELFNVCAPEGSDACAAGEGLVGGGWVRPSRLVGVLGDTRG